ncbi:ArsA family ATPase [Neobacillus kokaensis]|uniref:Arsenic-transporting ATPase n=1 Tax=Neobacillus kokaensis TaxID=2759023 RepID=A0ABQ3N374_9BACI|nr:ArsA family ATPase [Neobacillus kokaensis]GHH98022.1 arsenic-transporting ATPase [Neobacillus kokaensis]
MKKIWFVGGKGGVGKSTSAAALALLLSEQLQQKTLLVSTDPAHNIGDIFHKPLKNKPLEVSPHLDAVEIDPAAECRNYIKTVKRNIRGVISAQMQAEVHRQIDAASSSPGAEEAALFDRIVSIILDEGERYDAIVFDTAPTGHTIRLLTLPEIMGVWINGMLERRKKTTDNYTQLLNDGDPIDDPIYQVLQLRKQRFAAVRQILMDNQSTCFIFVLNAERLPILETSKAIKLLKQHGLEVNTLFINKVLGEEATGAFWQKRRKNEEEYLDWINREFPGQQKCQIPLFETDINSMTLLARFAAYLKENLKGDLTN